MANEKFKISCLIRLGETDIIAGSESADPFLKELFVKRIHPMLSLLAGLFVGLLCGAAISHRAWRSAQIR